MTHRKAFTDTEIVTIATVAAAALGGIVVGLGRGQESEPDPPERRGLKSTIVDAAVEAASSASGSLPTLPTPAAGAVDNVQRPEISQLLDTVQSEIGALVSRASSAPTPTRPSLDQLKQAIPDRPSTNLRGDLAKGALSLAATFLKQKIDEAAPSRPSNASAIRSLVSERIPESIRSSDNESSEAAGIQDKLGKIDDIKSRVGGPGDTVSAARSRTASIIEAKVTRPVASAASSTKSATAEAIAATGWLAAGAAVVYFGLLSADRREQVKTVICGGVEQVRLLFLDLQGYEPEM